jgi:transposase-like protein
MSRLKPLYKHHRFPPEVIQYAVWLYYRFNLNHRGVEDLLSERGITVSYESILPSSGSFKYLNILTLYKLQAALVKSQCRIIKYELYPVKRYNTKRS